LDRWLVFELEELLQALSLTVEELADPIGQGVESEVGDAEDMLRSAEHMAGQDPELHPQAQVDGGEVGRGCHQHHQSLKTMIGQAPHVLQTVALLDEPDDILDPPAGDVGLDDMPDRLPAATNREVRLLGLLERDPFAERSAHFRQPD